MAELTVPLQLDMMNERLQEMCKALRAMLVERGVRTQTGDPLPELPQITHEEGVSYMTESLLKNYVTYSYYKMLFVLAETHHLVQYGELHSLSEEVKKLRTKVKSF